MTFGMAFSRIGMPVAEIRDYLDFSGFNALELPWEVFFNPDSTADTLYKEICRRNKTVLCGAVMESRLSRSITFAEDRFQKDFSLQLARALQFLASRNIRTATLDCPLENFLENEAACNDMRRILQGAANVLVKENMTLLLPCAVPAAVSHPAVMCFMRNTQIPGIKLRLDIMPWHPECAATPVEDLIGRLPMETRAVIFKYDANCGNRILKEQVKPVLTALKKFNFTGSVLLASMSQQNRMAYPEANQFSEILKELSEFTGS